MLDSEELAAQMERWNVGGISQIVFVIGGSLGLAPAVLQRADYKLSFFKNDISSSVDAGDSAGADLPEFPYP